MPVSAQAPAVEDFDDHGAPMEKESAPEVVVEAAPAEQVQEEIQDEVKPETVEE